MVFVETGKPTLSLLYVPPPIFSLCFSAYVEMPFASIVFHNGEYEIDKEKHRLCYFSYKYAPKLVNSVIDQFWSICYTKLIIVLCLQYNTGQNPHGDKIRADGKQLAIFVFINKLKQRGVFMALIKCSECSKEISDKAESCPNCGNPNEIQHLVTKEAERATLSAKLVLLTLLNTQAMSHLLLYDR